MSGLGQIVVARSTALDCVIEKHRVIEVGSANRTPVDYSDPQIRQLAADLAGTLARLALAILPNLQGNADAIHRCTWRPKVWPDQPGEIRESLSVGYACRATLADHNDNRAEGRLPSLIAWVPHDRERAWIRRLTTELRELNRLDTEPPTTPLEPDFEPDCPE